MEKETLDFIKSHRCECEALINSFRQYLTAFTQEIEDRERLGTKTDKEEVIGTINYTYRELFKYLFPDHYEKHFISHNELVQVINELI